VSGPRGCRGGEEEEEELDEDICCCVSFWSFTIEDKLLEAEDLGSIAANTG
jgi:hypothetical protein